MQCILSADRVDLRGINIGFEIESDSASYRPKYVMSDWLICSQEP